MTSCLVFYKQISSENWSIIKGNNFFPNEQLSSSKSAPFIQNEGKPIFTELSPLKWGLFRLRNR